MSPRSLYDHVLRESALNGIIYLLANANSGLVPIFWLGI